MLDVRQATATVAFTFTTPTERAMQCAALDPSTGEWYVSQAQGFPPKTEHTLISRQSATGARRALLSTMRLVGGGHGTTISVLRRGDTLGIVTYWDKLGLVWLPYRPGDVKREDPGIVKVFPGYAYAHIDHAHNTVCLRKGNTFRLFELDGDTTGAPIARSVTIGRKLGQPGQGYFTVYSDGEFLLFAPYGYGHLKNKQTVDVWSFTTGTMLYSMPARVLPSSEYLFQEPESGFELDGVAYLGMSSRKRLGKKTPIAVRLDPAVLPQPTPVPIPDPGPAAGLRGNDVSSYQPLWKPAPGAGFAFVKSTEGTGYFNPFRSVQLDRARTAGLVVGHYHFLRPGQPAKQAAHFLATSDIQPGDLLVCDWENTRTGHPTVAEAAEFIAEVKRLKPDHRVGLYCNRSDWMTTTVKAGDFLWIAEYGVASPATGTDWTFWQYTSKPLDTNLSTFTDIGSLSAWAKGDL